jgi:hypothetical protein
MTRVGITGHRDLHDPTRGLVSTAIAMQLGEFGSVHGISSLAERADQIFAEQVLKAGGTLTVVIPSAHWPELCHNHREGGVPLPACPGHRGDRAAAALRQRRPTWLRGSGSSGSPTCS